MLNIRVARWTMAAASPRARRRRRNRTRARERVIDPSHRPRRSSPRVPPPPAIDAADAAADVSTCPPGRSGARHAQARRRDQGRHRLRPRLRRRTHSSDRGRDFGARGVGIDIDPQRIAEANATVKQAGVGNRVQIRQEDLFQADIKEATVVTLYLLQSLNMKLRPKLLAELSRARASSRTRSTWATSGSRRRPRRLAARASSSGRFRRREKVGGAHGASPWTLCRRVVRVPADLAGFLFACHGAQKLLGALGGNQVQLASQMGLAGIIELVGAR